MSLRLKIFLLLFLFLLVYGTVETGIHRFVVLPKFFVFEQKEAKKDIQRWREALKRETAQLDSFTREWVVRQDIYQFVKKNNDEYFNYLFDFSFFKDKRINLLYFLDKKGALIWGQEVDLETKKSPPPDPFPDPLLPTVKNAFSGLLMTGRGPLLVASRAILRKDIKESIEGFLVAGRWLDDHLIERINSETQIASQVWPLNRPLPEGVEKEALQNITPEAPFFLNERDGNHLDIYCAFPDVNGTAALLIKANIPRDISSQGKTAIAKVLFSLLAVGTALTLVLWWLFQKVVVDPIERLTGHARHITHSSDLSMRLNNQSNDEIGTLANAFDRMMERVEGKTIEGTKFNKELMNEISQHKRTEAALQESEERYRLLAENATDIIWTTGLDYRYTYVSPSVTQLRGYSVEEVMNQSIKETVTPSSLQMIEDLIVSKAWEIETITEEIGSKAITLELEQPCKDGSTVWIETKIRYLFGPTGKPSGYLGIARDITNRKKSEQALRESEEKFRRISEQSLIGILIIQDSRVIYINEKAAQVSGYSREEILSWKAEEFLKTVHPDYFEELFEAENRHKQGAAPNEALHFIFKAITKDKKDIWIEQYSRAIQYQGRDAILNVMLDITDRKKQEEELRTYQEHLEELVEERTAKLKYEINDRKQAQEEVGRLNKELEERVSRRTAELDRACEELKALDKMKDSFLSLVSHELRTPLTSIRSFSEILLKYEDEDPETRAEFMAIINSESERLTRLINDVLDLSRIEAGEMPWKDEGLSMKTIIQDATKAQQQLLKKKAIRLTLIFSEDIPPVIADRDRIQQVITNLLGNAIKFSLEGGEIRIYGEMITIGTFNEARQCVKISISDKGIGIEEKNHKAIFNKFHQVPNDALKSKPQGTGLGLPICKEIITHYKGEIWVESGLGGRGCTFSFTLPITN